ncbi:cytochrome P450 [Mariannaea sp. PMI_226]|nr:cytochrome P450 [Mariannaea sp. PMI_226]
MAVLETLPALSWQEAGCLFVGIWSIYVASLAIYRLWFSPLAHIPGPKLAALTQYYEIYYDVVLGGQYTFKINDMHEKYGPIVRINPWEVHVGDPDFFSELYTGPSSRRDKWTFYTQQSGAPQSSLATIDHNPSKLRRSALNPFYSTHSVRRLQPVIEERVDALLAAFLNYAEVSNGQPLDVMYPYSALTNDVINEYAFSRSHHLVEKSDFGAEVTNNLLIGTHMGPFVQHVSWVLTLVNALPESISSRCMPGWGGFVKMKNDILDHIRNLEAQQSPDPNSFKPREKSAAAKPTQEGQLLVEGGTLTTSWAMSLATFHLLKRPDTLRKLRDELFEVIPDPKETLSLSKLENLPYLCGVVKEALRLSIGTSSRLARVAPNETLVFHDRENDKEWQLPPGSVVGMSPYKTVMDENIFYDARGFHPERWVEDGERLEKYLSIFCSGNRVCLGMALAHAEMSMVLAKLFRQWGSGGVLFGDDEGDVRDGDLGCLSIYETRVRDCEMSADYFIPIPYKGSEGLRFVFEPFYTA